jgi:pimeloyl-ACP methyl ester carboxylesterase
MDLLPGVRANDIGTDRLRIHYIESGPADGVPVVMIHGNLATARFFEHLMPAAPADYRLIAPDMRGFGDTERVPIDSTGGLQDWADDAYALVKALAIEQPVHLVGWSTGGAAIAAYAEDRPVASLTFVDPVSPYGFGGAAADGNPNFPDWAGSGGGTGNPEFTQRLADGDRSADALVSPRNVMNTSYWSATHRETKEREDMLLDEILKSETGEHGYPGDLTPSQNWPGVAPGVHGILNALSGKYCNWSTIVGIDPKPPILWTHGTEDIVISDASAWDMGNLGRLGLVPGWPGEEVFPPQPMVTQIRTVLERYRGAGGRVEMEMFEGSGHGPIFDAAERWSRTYFGFLASVEAEATTGRG